MKTFEEAMQEHYEKQIKKQITFSKAGYLIGQLTIFILIICRKITCNW